MIRLPLEEELRRERMRLIDTLASLSDEEFDAGPTLCSEWAPRDVLAHVIGVDEPAVYVRYRGRLDDANDAVVREARALSRGELMARAQRWSEAPSRMARAAAGPLLLGDLAMHHQDILRALGRNRDLPRAVAAAVFREGVLWSWPFGRKLLRYRVMPTTVGARPLGRGRRVRGTTEALGMWLAGRPTIEPELEFAPSG